MALHLGSFDMDAAGLPIRRLSAADLAVCVELAADRGCLPERNKLRLLFAVGEAYGIDDPAGGLAAMVVLTRYGRQLAVVGTMVVASRFGRRGLGRRLTTHLLDQVGRAVVYLGANSRSYSRPLFRAWGPQHRHRHPARGPVRSAAACCRARLASPRLDVRPRADGRAGPEGVRRGSQAGADGAFRLRRAGLGCGGRPTGAGRFRGSMAQRG